MDIENEKKMEEKSSSEQQGSREGYQKEFRPVGRSPRPRIHTGQSERPSYNKFNKEDDGEFRPEGFGTGLQSQAPQQRGGYRPRTGGYQSRQGYQSRSQYGQEDRSQSRQGGYQQRQGYQPRQQYGQSDEHQGYSRQGYQPRQGGYQQRPESGYQQRPESGYQQRPESGYQQRQGGYQPRQGGYQQRGGGYQQRQGGYQQRGGGYQPRQGGGYQQRGGGYQQRQGGYRPRTADYDPNAKYSLKKRIEYKEVNFDPNEPIRLNKYLANAGVCSRREADEFIQAGVVTVNGEVVTELGTKVMRTDVVRFHEDTVSLEKKVYVLLNKPKDYVTTSDDPQQRKTVMDLVKNACPERIYPVGRLDRNTTGVLLLTNDGDLASKLTHPKFLKKKIYHVHTDRNVTAHDLQQIADGVMLEDGEIKADSVEYADPVDKKQVGIEIHSGKNRIVRRIFESLGYKVVKLDRVQFAGLTKKNLRRGEWRYLTQEEVDRLRMGAYE